jgi:hypothetical protein
MLQQTGWLQLPLLSPASPALAADQPFRLGASAPSTQPLEIGSAPSTSQALATRTSAESALVAARSTVPVLPSTSPSISAPVSSQPVSAALIWRGTVGQNGNLRAAPRRNAPVIGQLSAGQPVTVVHWVDGDEIESENTT